MKSGVWKQIKKKTLYMGCGAETKYLLLEDKKGCIRGWKEFMYLEVKIDKKGRQENNKNRINKGRRIRAMLKRVLWNRQIQKITNKQSNS